MNIYNLQNFILTELNKHHPIDSISHSKKPKDCDFIIFTPHNIESLKIKYIQSIKRVDKMVRIKIDRTQIIDDILSNIFYPKPNSKNACVVVEYSSPNIAKKFHPGHLRTTMIGNFVNNILKTQGYQTVSINYLGDWGKQFGMLGVGYEKYGDDEKLKSDPIKHLYEVYVKINQDLAKEKQEITDLKDFKESENDYDKKSIDYESENVGLKNESDAKSNGEKNSNESNLYENLNGIDHLAKEWFTKLENGDLHHRKLWSKFRELSVDKYMDLYKMLNVKFDVYSGESFYALSGKEIIHANEIFLKDEDNSFYVDTKHGKLCVLKQDGSTLYSTRDLAAASDRKKLYNPELMIYVVASQQDLYFKQLFEVLEKTLGGKYLHLNYGMVNGMSTRKGTVVFLEDIINETKNVMHEKMKANEEKYKTILDVDKTCEILAVSAIIVQDFAAKRIKNYTFDINQCTEINGFTGPYLQYCHCRLKSIEEKNNEIYSQIVKKQNKKDNKNIDEDKKLNFDDKNINVDDNKNIKASKNEEEIIDELKQDLENIKIEDIKTNSLTNTKQIFNIDNLQENNLDEILHEEVEKDIYDFTNFDVKLLNDKCLDILFYLYKYPYIIDKSAENFEPNTLLTYLMDLCKSINGIISDVRVMGVDNKLAVTRLTFYMACRKVIKSGIKILGMTPLDRM